MAALFSFLNLVMTLNRDRILNLAIANPLLSSIFSLFPVGVIALLAFLIYRKVTKKVPLVGLEKHLMNIWLLVMAMNIIPPKIKVTSSPLGTANLTDIIVHVDNLSVLLFSLAIALLITAMFTGYKQPRTIGMIYIAISLLHAYFNLPPLGDPVSHFLYLVALPFTFLYLGFFLKAQDARG